MNNLSGVYLVYKKWDLIYLSNKKSHFEEYMNYDKFLEVLNKAFVGDIIKSITEAINTEKKLILDFDKQTAKLVKEKEVDFLDHFKTYFSEDAVLDWLNNKKEEESDPYLYYTKETNL